MENHHLLHPLLPTTTTTITTTAFTPSSSTIEVKNNTNAYPIDVEGDDTIQLEISSDNSKIIIRLCSVILVGIISIWANHEASKGFEINIQNDATNSAAGHRFQLLYVSNDKATRLVLNTSIFVETLLYPNNSSQSKKQVNRVTLQLASRNLTHMVIVESFKEQEFVLHLSPSILEQTNFDHAMLRALQQGMARVWLYDNAPISLLNGMVEYVSSLAGLGSVMSDSSAAAAVEQPKSDNICWKDKNHVAVARFLNYCEERRRGFIQRLNQAMKSSWHDRMVDEALGMPAQHLCASYTSL